MPKQSTDTPTSTSTPTNPGTETPNALMGKATTSLLVVLLVGAIAAAGYFYMQLAEAKKNPNKVSQDETQATIAAVGKLMVLPSGEQPTLATVTDPEKLKDQPFFASAKSGDKVLIYTNAKKAILYNPTENKIIEVAPVSIGTNNQTQVSGSSTENQ